MKGDSAKTENLRTRLMDAKRFLDQAEQARESGYAGSDRWLEHQHLTVERLTELCRIMDDPAVPNGTCVQLGQKSAPMEIAGQSVAPVENAAGAIENV